MRQLQNTQNVTLSPSLFVILNPVKDFEGLRLNLAVSEANLFVKGLVFPASLSEERFFSPATGGGSE